MATQQVTTAYSTFVDLDGSALNAGYLYLGVKGTNPVNPNNQINVYYDQELQTPASQPIRTVNGYPSRNGSAAQLYTTVDYSIVVQNNNQELVYSSLSPLLPITQSDLPWYNVTDYGDGSKTSATIATAISDIETILGAGEKFGLLFQSGDWTLTTSTLPSNIEILVENGVNFQIGNGETVTINGTYRFPDNQIFSLTGTGTVSFGASKRTVNVLWFGADPTNVTDSEPAINAAIASITEGKVLLPSGDYRVDDEIIINKNNIHLESDATATLVVESSTSTTSGWVIKCEATSSGIWPVNISLTNIFVEISTNSGGNTGGMLLGCSYSNFYNIGSRIRGDNMIGIRLQTDESGTGPYYNVFHNVTAQGDSNSTTPLNGVIGIDLKNATIAANRCPNANTFIGGRTGGCYDALKIRGAGNRFLGMTHEAINNYIYHFLHETVSSGSIRNTVVGPYIELYNTATAFYFQLNASANICMSPYYTGISTLFDDQSTLQNNRLIDDSTLPDPNAVVVKAQGYMTHPTTVTDSFNIASLTNTATGKYRVSFTNSFANGRYYTDITNVGTGVGTIIRVDQQTVGFVDISFFDDTGTLVNVTNFTVKISAMP